MNRAMCVCVLTCYREKTHLKLSFSIYSASLSAARRWFVAALGSWPWMGRLGRANLHHQVFVLRATAGDKQR